MRLTSAKVGLLAYLTLALCLTNLSYAGSSISGSVPLPEAPPAAVMTKRYEIVSKGGALATTPPLAVVWVEGDFPQTGDPENVEIAQRDFIFEPAILPIQVGTTVAFPNYDSEYHNVFSYSRAKRFDLGRYMPNERPVPTQTFNKPGPVILRCDIHEHMKAIILVLDTPYFVKTDAQGNFQLQDLPAGNYVLKAWVDTKTTLQTPVSLDGSSDLEINFESE